MPPAQRLGAHVGPVNVPAGVIIDVKMSDMGDQPRIIQLVQRLQLRVEGRHLRVEGKQDVRVLLRQRLHVGHGIDRVAQHVLHREGEGVFLRDGPHGGVGGDVALNMLIGSLPRPKVQHQQLRAHHLRQRTVRPEQGKCVRQVVLADPLADLLGHVEHRHIIGRKGADEAVRMAVMPALVHHELQPVAVQTRHNALQQAVITVVGSGNNGSGGAQDAVHQLFLPFLRAFSFHSLISASRSAKRLSSPSRVGR